MATANPPLDPHLFLRARPPCASHLSCDLQAFTLPEFRDPLVFALLALAAGLVAVLAWRVAGDARRRRRLGAGELTRPLPLAGLLVTASALAGYERTGHLVPGLALAVAVLAAGGLLADATRLPLAGRFVLAVPGAVLVAWHSALPDPAWALRLAAVATVLGAGLVADLDSRAARLGLGPVLLAVAVVGLYECEPDPDFALLLVGATVPLALLAWPLPLARLGGAGAAAMSGLMVWAATVGGRGMLGAVVSGCACFGLLAVLPLARLAAFRRQSVLERLPRRWWTPVVVGAVQLAVVAGLSRVAPGRTPAQALLIVGVGFGVLFVAALALSGRRPAAPADPAAPVAPSHAAAPLAGP